MARLPPSRPRPSVDPELAARRQRGARHTARVLETVTLDGERVARRRRKCADVSVVDCLSAGRERCHAFGFHGSGRPSHRSRRRTSFSSSFATAPSSASPDRVVVSTVNSAPVANAGADQGVFVGVPAHLDGSGSTDVDGNALVYVWSLTTRPAGSTATLTNPTAVNPTLVPDLAGEYVAQLVVNDVPSTVPPTP